MLKKTLILLSVVGAMLMMYAGPVLAQTRIPPDLTISYPSGPTKVAPGATSIYYSANVDNKGGSTAVFPDGTVVATQKFVGAARVSYCGAQTGYYCTIVGGDTVEVVSQGENTLGAGQGIWVHASVDAPTTTGKMTTTQTADPNETVSEVSESNNASSITTYVGSPPATDLSVTQVDTEDPTYVDGWLTYTVKVTNNGEDTAFNAVVEDYLPENATFQYAYGRSTNCNHILEYGAVVCSMGDIPSGESREMQIEVRPTAAGTISNTATVYNDNGDPNAANDSVKEDTLVQADPIYEPPDTTPPPVDVTPLPDTTRPTVSSMAPRLNSTTRDRTPTIRAVVRDNLTNLVKSNVRLYVDGRRVTTFSYSPSTDRLSYTTKALPYGRHTAKIIARDAAGNVATKQWSFRITR